MSSDSLVRLASLRDWLNRLRMKQLNQAPPTHFDLDVIRLEVDADEERHQHGADLVRRHRWKLFGNLATARDQALLVSAIGMFIANSVENRRLDPQKTREAC